MGVCGERSRCVCRGVGVWGIGVCEGVGVGCIEEGAIAETSIQ